MNSEPIGHYLFILFNYSSSKCVFPCIYICVCVCVCVCAFVCVQWTDGWLAAKGNGPLLFIRWDGKGSNKFEYEPPTQLSPSLSHTHTHTIIYQPCSPMYPSLSASLSQQRAVACLLRAATVSTTDSTNSHFLPLTYTHSTSLCNAAASDVFVGLSLYYIPVRLKRPPGVILSNWEGLDKNCRTTL